MYAGYRYTKYSGRHTEHCLGKDGAQSVLMHRHHQRPGAGHAIQSITQHPPALSGQD